MFKVNNKTTTATSWRHSGAFIVNFEHVSQLFLPGSHNRAKGISFDYDF